MSDLQIRGRLALSIAQMDVHNARTGFPRRPGRGRDLVWRNRKGRVIGLRGDRTRERRGQNRGAQRVSLEGTGLNCLGGA